MKRFTLILVVAIIAMFSSYQAKAQCPNCPPPNICTTLTVSYQGCDNITVDICYYCYVGQNRIDFSISGIHNICPGVDVHGLINYIEQYVLTNEAYFCGNVPCTHVTITSLKPYCVTVNFDGTFIDVIACSTWCSTVWDSYLCTPDCIPICFPLGIHLTSISNILTGPSCGSPITIGPNTPYPYTNGKWKIPPPPCSNIAGISLCQ